MFKKVIYFLLFVLLFASCSKYQKLLKSSDYDLKYSKALEYYEKKDYYRAMTLFEELMNIYKGTVKAENVYYYFAYCNYALEDFLLAGYHFNNFAKTFPSSKHTEEARYLSAYCYYMDSPNYSLDQSATIKAIEEFQIFIEQYPKSERIAKCNELVDELREKLETKSYQNAKLYYELTDYKAAVVALKLSLKEFPDTKYREEMMYLVVESYYKLAENSVEAKKKDRYQLSVDEYFAFLDQYPTSKYLKDAERIYENSLGKLKK